MTKVKQILSFVAGAALLAATGVAAAESMKLSNDQMDGITAGVGFTSNTFVTKLVEIRELIEEQKLAFFTVFTDVENYSAVAEAEADCLGLNCDAQTFTFAEIEFVDFGLWKTNSLSKSIALHDPRPGNPRP